MAIQDINKTQEKVRAIFDSQIQDLTKSLESFCRKSECLTLKMKQEQ